MLLYGLLCCVAFSVLVEGQGAGNRPRSRLYRGRSPSRSGSSAYRAMARRGGQRQRMNAEAGGGGGGGNDPDIPQNWRDLLARNGGVHDVNDFINLLETEDGRRVQESDIFSPYLSPEGKRVITGGGIMATSDECSPRNMSVRLPLNYEDNQIAYYPECTMVQRCGGCTPTPFLSCEPLYKEKVVLKVLRARYLHPGAVSMRWEGFSSVEVERHLSCRAVCNLTPRDCNQNQRFNPYQCKCVCMRFQRCFNEKVWDPAGCRCRCPNEGPCCAEHGEEDDRTCTSYFDHDFCECTLKTSIGAPLNASQAEIDAWLASRPGGGRGQVTPPLGHFTPPPTTRPPTTRAPTTPTTAPSNCPSRRCPRNFVMRVNENGNCVCVFGRVRPRRRG